MFFSLSLALPLNFLVLISLCPVHIHLRCSTLALTHVSLHTLIFHHSYDVFHLESFESDPCYLQFLFYANKYIFSLSLMILVVLNHRWS